MGRIRVRNTKNIIKIQELYSSTLIELNKGRMLEFLTDEGTSSRFRFKYI
jgi:hypothetical protein